MNAHACYVPSIFVSQCPRPLRTILLSVRIILSLFVSRRPHPLPSIFVAMSSQHEDEFDELAANGLLSHVDIQDLMTRSSEGNILTDGHGKITAINKP